jgi:hypothetical protein
LWVTLFTPTPNASNELRTCGARQYSALDSTRHPVLLAATGLPRIGSQVTLDMDRGPANGAFGLLFATAADRLDLPSPPVSVLVSLRELVLAVAVPASPVGSASVPVQIPDDTALIGARVYVQAVGASTELRGGNAVEIRICPR